MIIVTSTDVWADTIGVQAAVAVFSGRHIGFGDFAVSTASGDINFLRRDVDKDGRAMAEQYGNLGFSGRPHILDGAPEAIDAVVLALAEFGYLVIYKEEEA